MHHPITASEMPLFLALASLILGFLLHWRLTLAFKRGSVGQVSLLRWSGLVLFGLMPMAALVVTDSGALKNYGLAFTMTTFELLCIGGAVVLAIVVNLLSASKEDNLAMYPQIREKEWTPKTFVAEYAGWIAYLFGYEFMFRGLLFFASLEVMSFWPAVMLNTSLYAFIHLPKGPKEAIGAVPLGIVLCLITAETGNFWVAFLAHCALAISNSIFSFRAHPDMRRKGSTT